MDELFILNFLVAFNALGQLLTRLGLEVVFVHQSSLMTANE
jgi:hypothetical protein